MSGGGFAGGFLGFCGISDGRCGFRLAHAVVWGGHYRLVAGNGGAGAGWWLRELAGAGWCRSRASAVAAERGLRFAIAQGEMTSLRPGMTGETQTSPPHGAIDAEMTSPALAPGSVTSAWLAVGHAVE